MTSVKLPSVAAKTHPPRYRLHKYWSRKPHNVVREFVFALLEEPGVVVDPFVGSGVVAFEAATLGHRVYACDVNPVSVLLARTTAAPPPSSEFCAVVEKVVAEVEREFAELWTCPVSGKTIRYVVYEVEVACPACGLPQTESTVSGKGRARRCSGCGATVRLNLEWMAGTNVVGIALVGDKALHSNEEMSTAHAELARVAKPVGPFDSLDAELEENRRILAFAGMSSSDLFTPRVLRTLLAYRDRIAAVEDPRVRNAALLLLTASAAQCSRLTAFRNNLTTGGPAWSVPGFWVPPRHLETNPLVHLRARLRRFRKGIDDAHEQLGRGHGAVEVGEADAVEYMRELSCRGVRADLVVLDPPYGDSVPFVEFSAFWNALLDRVMDASVDASVSDRESKQESWERYRTKLREVMTTARELLGPAGRVLVAFNNHDLRAWRALLEASQVAGLVCLDVVYQFPAVVSSKASFHPKGSYVGDFWAVLAPSATAGLALDSDLQPAVEALARCASSRGGVCAENLVYRTLAMTWLKMNLKAEHVDDWGDLVGSLFEPAADQMLRWKGALPGGVPDLASSVHDAARDALASGPMDWKDFYRELALRCDDYGAPDPAEVRVLLGDTITMSDKRVMAISARPEAQMSLFAAD